MDANTSLPTVLCYLCRKNTEKYIQFCRMGKRMENRKPRVKLTTFVDI